MRINIYHVKNELKREENKEIINNIEVGVHFNIHEKNL